MKSILKKILFFVLLVAVVGGVVTGSIAIAKHVENINSADCAHGVHSFDSQNKCLACGEQAPQRIDFTYTSTKGYYPDYDGYNLGYTIYPENSTLNDLVWSSSNEDAVTVDEQGFITFVGIGTSIISVKSVSGVGASCSVEVCHTYPEETLLFYSDKYYYDTSYLETETLRRRSISISREASDEYLWNDFVWASSNEDVAKIYSVPAVGNYHGSSNATLYLQGEGTATITATAANGVSATAQVYVGKRVNLTLVDFDPENVMIGDTYQLEYEFLPERLAGELLHGFYSSNENVATVDRDTGLVTIVGYGDVTFTAKVTSSTYYSSASNASVSVSVPELEFGFEVDSLKIYLTDKNPTNARSGVACYFSNKFKHDYTYILSSNSNVLEAYTTEYSSFGNYVYCNVKGVGLGTANLIFNYDGLEIELPVEVIDGRTKEVVLDYGFQTEKHLSPNCPYYTLPEQIPEYDIELPPYSFAPKEYLLNAQALPVDPSGRTDTDFCWTSSNEQVATVDSNGLVTAVDVGEAVITATALNGASASFNIIVDVYVEEISIEGDYVPFLQGTELLVGDNVALNAVVTPSNANMYDIYWQSNNTSVATVDNNGVVTALNEGVATISVYRMPLDRRPMAQIVVYVTVPIDSVELDYELAVGVWDMNTEPASNILLPIDRAERHIGLALLTQLPLVTFVAPSNATISNDYVNHSLKYSSLDTSIATVNADGVITAKRVGTTVITVNADSGASDSITVSVLLPQASISDISLQLGATRVLSELYYTLAEFNSSDPSIVSIDSQGVLTAHAVGTVNISVISHDPADWQETYQSTITVTVTEDPETFADYSWARIAELSNNGEAKSKFNVGDEKQVTLTNGEVLTFVILDFNHDYEGSHLGTAGITFGLKNLLSTKSAMNSTNSNTASSLMSETLSSIFEQLPEDLQAVIKNVDKSTSAGGKSRTIKTTSEKLFLFSELEVFGVATGSFGGEGSQYAYFAQNANRVLTSNGVACNWLLRSPSKDSYTAFRAVYQSGSIGTVNANVEAGICFGFCI